MKVLLITPEYPPDFGGGIGRYAGSLAAGLKGLGCEVEVLKGSAFVHGRKPYELEGVKVCGLENACYEKWLGYFSHFTQFPELLRHLAAAFALHEQARAGEGYDVVEVTDWGMLFVPWALESKARVLVQMHGSCGQIASREPVSGREVEGAFSTILERAALGGNTTLSAVSRINQSGWQSILGKPVSYLAPPLFLESAEYNGTLGSDWLVTGRIQLWKGPQIACAAWQLLGDQAPRLQWIGRDTVHGASGRSTDAWLKQEFPSVWRQAIQPVGQLPPPEVRRRMLAAKAILIPSVWDTFNLAAVEAMSLGKVVVISDGAGAVDLIENGVNGFMFSNGDVAALAQLVRQVENLSQEDLRCIGQRAANTVREKLNPRSIAAAKMALYRELPQPMANELSWLRCCLFPENVGGPYGFLDGLPLKELTRYVARRALKKYFRKSRS